MDTWPRQQQSATGSWRRPAPSSRCRREQTSYSPTETLGLNAVERICERDLAITFRLQSKDVGIDALLELRDVNPTGQLVAAQIKAGRSQFKARANDFLYYGEIALFKYWLAYSLPVVLIAHFSDPDETFWVRVTETNVTPTGKLWRISIPKEQIFGLETKDAIRALFVRPWREPPEDPMKDSLTGLANRRAMDAQLRRELTLAGRRPLSLIFVDVDSFKAVNEQHGHTVGDEVLRQAVQCLRSSIGRRRSLIARYGGDEFVVSLPGKSLGEALKLAQRIRSDFAARPFLVGKTPIKLTASCGVSSTGQLGADTEIDSMLWRADAALYQAKKAGRNCVRAYDPSQPSIGPRRRRRRRRRVS